MESMNDFDKIIKDKIGSIEQMPPAHLWANISKGIAVPQVAAIPFYKSSSFIISAAVASIVVVMGAMWFFADSNITDNKTPIAIDTNYNENVNTIVEDHDYENNKGIEPQSFDNVDQQQQIVNEADVPNDDIIENRPNNIAPVEAQPNNATKHYKRKKMSYATTAAVNNSKEQSLQDNLDDKSKEEALLLVSLTQILEEDVVVNKDLSQGSEEEKVADNDIKKNTIAENTIVEEKIAENIIVEETIDEKKVELDIALKEGAISKQEDKNNVEVGNTEEVKHESSLAVVEENTNKTIESKEESKEIAETTIEENEAQQTETKAIVSNNTKSVPDDEMPKSQFNPRTANFDKMAIGVHFGLENIKVDDINIATYNGDISFNYQNMNFIAQTGIGLQMSKDKNNYHQHISTSEYQETQIRFDSVIFVSDGNGGMKPIPVDPTYEDVYDTINHVYESDVTETYYSIRIPLMIGYQKSFKNFGIFGKGGVIYSHIIKNNTGNMNEVDNNSVVMSTDYNMAERRSNQLQYVVSAGVSYAISKRMSFNAELMGKYYQYAMYTNSNYESNPWSYEARLGITYLLN